MPVSAIRFVHVKRNAFLDLFDPVLELMLSVVLGTVVHRFELSAVDRNFAALEHFQGMAKLDELPAYAEDCFGVVPAEVGNRLESGVSRLVSHIISTLRCVSRSRGRFEWIRLR